MLQLITMDWRITEGNTPVSIFHLGREIKTFANPILPPTPWDPSPYPWVDPWLVTLIALCLATEPQNVPSLPELTLYGQQAVRERTAAFYDDPDESNIAIYNLMRTILYDAPTD